VAVVVAAVGSIVGKISGVPVAVSMIIGSVDVVVSTGKISGVEVATGSIGGVKTGSLAETISVPPVVSVVEPVEGLFFARATFCAYRAKSIQASSNTAR